MKNLNIKNTKLQYFSFLNQITHAFRKSPFVYYSIDEIIQNLKSIQHKISQNPQKEKYLPIYLDYKTMIHACLNYWEKINDPNGKLTKFFDQLLKNYQTIIKNININFQTLCDDILKLYLREDYGYYFEIIQLIFLKIQNPDKIKKLTYLEQTLRIKKLKSQISTYKKYKLNLFLLELYDFSKQNDKYIHLCYSLDQFEKSLYLGKKYEKLHMLNKAIQVYQYAIKNGNHHSKQYFQKKMQNVKNKILGLSL